MNKKSDPFTIDFTKSMGYHLYSLAFIGNETLYPFAEKFYSLHQASIHLRLHDKWDKISQM